MIVLAQAVLACGPFFPNQVLVNGDAGALAMPAGDFAAEVTALCPAAAPPFRAVLPKAGKPWVAVSAYDQSTAVDVSDLDAALTAAGVAPDRRAAIVGPYTRLREQLSAHLRALADPDAPAPGPPYVDRPAGLPDEFADYVHGLIAYDARDPTAARRIWTELLARPPAQRHWRSTWAAFMIGRSYGDHDPARSSQAFAQTRALATDGFADSLGLAAASYGWEAKTELAAKHYPAACALYLQQLATGDPSAALSLRETAAAAFASGGDALAAVARDGLARRVLTAYVLSNGGPFHSLTDRERELVPAWLAAVRAAAATDVAGADRLAWAAYRSGDFAGAADWVARAPADAPVAGWVRAKLLLRDGKVDAAAAQLAKVVQSFPAELIGAGPILSTHTYWSADHAGRSIGSDLAVLRLTRGQYVDALDLLLRTTRWLDAAYVAERVLTVDELRAFVDRRFPAAPTTQPGDGGSDYYGPLTIDREAYDLRCLLARRLARADRWSDARPYFPPSLRKSADDYTAALRDGRDAKRSAAERAASLFVAARLARSQGMDLLGTELDPDYHAFAGQFQVGGAERARGQKDALTAPTADELSRWKATAMNDPRRWHYRYVAADLAWEAAALMPDGSDATAAVLYEAGCWLKDRDAKGAERFYKAMTKRCPQTDLGRRAAALHWFPKPPGPK